MKKVFGIVVVVGVLALALAGCKGGQVTDSATQPQLETGTVTPSVETVSPEELQAKLDEMQKKIDELNAQLAAEKAAGEATDETEDAKTGTEVGKFIVGNKIRGFGAPPSTPSEPAEPTAPAAPTLTECKVQEAWLAFQTVNVDRLYGKGDLQISFCKDGSLGDCMVYKFTKNQGDRNPLFKPGTTTSWRVSNANHFTSETGRIADADCAYLNYIKIVKRGGKGHPSTEEYRIDHSGSEPDDVYHNSGAWGFEGFKVDAQVKMTKSDGSVEHKPRYTVYYNPCVNRALQTETESNYVVFSADPTAPVKDTAVCVRYWTGDSKDARTHEELYTLFHQKSGAELTGIAKNLMDAVHQNKNGPYWTLESDGTWKESALWRRVPEGEALEDDGNKYLIGKGWALFSGGTFLNSDPLERKFKIFLDDDGYQQGKEVTPSWQSIHTEVEFMNPSDSEYANGVRAGKCDTFVKDDFWLGGNNGKFWPGMDSYQEVPTGQDCIIGFPEPESEI